MRSARGQADSVPTEETKHVKKMKWLGATGAVIALGAVGFVGTSSPASGTVTITAGPGSHVHCTITGVAKLAPALANDWDHTAHSSDPGDAFGPGSTATIKGGIASKTDPDVTNNATIKAAVASIPDTVYAANSGNPTVVHTAAKVVSTGTCSNTHVVDATTPSLTAEVASISIVSTSDSTGANEATCGGLADTSGTQFQSTVTYKSTSTTKIAPSVITSNLAAIADIGNTGVGFDLTADGTGGTSITGSFAGGSSESKAYIDGTTLNAILGASATSAAQATSVCEPTMSGKFTPAALGASDAVAIKLKKPKGLKAITIQSSNAAVNGQGSTIAPNDTPSTLDAVG